jgi:hypothetical protein
MLLIKLNNWLQRESQLQEKARQVKNMYTCKKKRE